MKSTKATAQAIPNTQFHGGLPSWGVDELPEPLWWSSLRQFTG